MKRRVASQPGPPGTSASVGGPWRAGFDATHDFHVEARVDVRFARILRRHCAADPFPNLVAERDVLG
jgi:hypothetical protein